jgi:hypothetical protein
MVAVCPSSLFPVDLTASENVSPRMIPPFASDCKVSVGGHHRIRDAKPIALAGPIPDNRRHGVVYYRHRQGMGLT